MPPLPFTVDEEGGGSPMTCKDAIDIITDFLDQTMASTAVESSPERLPRFPARGRVVGGQAA